jgi:catechol 2,3-dioxygenase-like lactoylglutathione lyase family enzyme
MDPRLSLVTLGVRDVSVAHAFYVDGLGWTPTLAVPGEVTFIQVGHGVLLGLWSLDELVAEVGEVVRDGPVPITLAHNVDDEATVDRVLADAQRAGGSVVVPAARRAWGGYNGYFADPDGYRWEVAHNPNLSVSDDGTVVLST